MLFKEEAAASGGQGNSGQHAVNVSAGTSSSTSTVEALAMSLKNTEVISILKRRNNSSENVNENLKYTNSTMIASGGGHSPSIHSQTYSDTSLQKYDDDDEDDSDSDWDGFQV